MRTFTKKCNQDVNIGMKETSSIAMTEEPDVEKTELRTDGVDKDRDPDSQRKESIEVNVCNLEESTVQEASESEDETEEEVVRLSRREKKKLEAAEVQAILEEEGVLDEEEGKQVSFIRIFRLLLLFNIVGYINRLMN